MYVERRFHPLNLDWTPMVYNHPSKILGLPDCLPCFFPRPVGVLVALYDVTFVALIDF